MADRMLLAVPSLGDGGLTGERSAHFGHCDAFTLVEIEDGVVGPVRVLPNPPHEHGGCLAPVRLLADEGVDALVVGGMGARPLAGFRQAGIAVYFDNATPGVGDVVALVAAGRVEPMDERAVCGGGGSCS